MTKKQLKKWIREIVNEVELDRTKDHLSGLKQEKQKSLNFKVDDMEYRVIFNEIPDENESILLCVFSFVNVTAAKNLVKEPGESIESYAAKLQRTKVGTTGTGKQMRVFNQIYNIFIQYIEKFKPKFVGYEALENNRQKLYTTLMNRVTKQSELKFEKIDKNPITNESLKPTEFYFEIGCKLPNI